MSSQASELLSELSPSEIRGLSGFFKQQLDEIGLELASEKTAIAAFNRSIDNQRAGIRAGTSYHDELLAAYYATESAIRKYEIIMASDEFKQAEQAAALADAMDAMAVAAPDECMHDTADDFKPSYAYLSDSD